MDYKKRIGKLLDERNWSVEELADNASVPLSEISNFLKTPEKAALSTLQAICRAFSVSLSDFFSEEKKQSITNEERQLLCFFRILPPQQRRQFTEQLYRLAIEGGCANH